MTLLSSKAIFSVWLGPQIPGETQQGSLLAAELAAVKFSGSQPSQTVSARQRDDTLSDGESLMGDPRVDHGADHGRGGGEGGARYVFTRASIFYENLLTCMK